MPVAAIAADVAASDEVGHLDILLVLVVCHLSSLELRADVSHRERRLVRLASSASRSRALVRRIGCEPPLDGPVDHLLDIGVAAHLSSSSSSAAAANSSPTVP
jgi:hypothetical protein